MALLSQYQILKPLDGLLVEPLDLSRVCIYPFLIWLRALCSADAFAEAQMFGEAGKTTQIHDFHVKMVVFSSAFLFFFNHHINAAMKT